MVAIAKTKKEFDIAMAKSTYTKSYMDGRWEGWHTKRLWELAKREPVTILSVSKFQPVIDKWMNGDSVENADGKIIVPFDTRHFLRIRNANLSFPIIVEANGRLIMDGYHRLMKCYLANLDIIKAVQFAVTPEPDLIYYPKNEVHMW